MQVVEHERDFRLLLGLVGALLWPLGLLSAQTNAPAIPFIHLILEAKTNYSSGDTAKARELLNQFVQLNELDALHRTLSLDRDLAEFCSNEGDRQFAKEILERGLQIAEKTAGPGHFETSFALANLGVFYLRGGDAAGALPLLERVLNLVQKNFGEKSAETASALELLAMCHTQLRRYPQAISLREQSVGIRETLAVEDQLALLNSRAELASLYELQGNFAAALPLLQRNVQTGERVLGPDLVSLLTSTNKTLQAVGITGASKTNAVLLAGSQGQLCQLQRVIGKYSDALDLALRWQRLNERLFGVDSPGVAEALMVQASIQSERDQQQKDELVLPLLSEVYRILELNYGKDDARLVIVLNNLGVANKNVGRSAEALKYFERSLEIVERSSGTDNLASVTILMNLAASHRDRGEYAIALPLHERSVRIYEKYFGKGNPATLLASCHLAIWYIKQGLFPRFIFEENGASSVWRRYLPTQLPLLSDADAEALADKLRFFTDGMHSMGNVKYSAGAEDFARFAAEGLAMDKALLEEASTARIAFGTLPDERVRKLKDRYNALENRVGALPLSTATAEELAKRHSDLQAEIIGIETNLAQFSAIVEQSLRERDLSLADLAQSLPSESVLVDFAKYRRWDYCEPNRNWKEERYVVYLTFPAPKGCTNLTVRRVDLGEAAPIDRAVELVCKRMSSGQFAALDLKDSLLRLNLLVYEPIAELVANASQLIICPDGELGRLPFELFPIPNKKGKFLIEEKTIVYVGSGREVIRLARSAGGQTAHPALVFGNPDFELDLTNSSTGLQIARSEPGHGLALNEPFALRSLSPDYGHSKFSPLAGTETEARSIAKLLGADCGLFLGKDARESQLKAAVSPRVVHLATHGFFLSDQDTQPGNISADLLMPVGLSQNRGTKTKGGWENPMLRCGIALAGANHALGSKSAAAEDGLLTGLEASLLNLRGTELVILSACDTGAGDVKIGEGVMSLRRAFRIAGAETVIASHWKVSDKATSLLITEFIRRWRSGEPRGKAWRNAQLSLLHSKEFSNPYYWAAFTLTGQWH